MADINQLISQAQQYFNQGDHTQAVQSLTDAVQQNPDNQQMSSIESLIGKIANYIMGNQSGDSNGSRGISDMFMNALNTNNNGNAQSQLGKLALLSSVLGGGSN
ncbi:hypothetical protein C6P45_004834, partial [Maudiozyma exigua]